MGMRPVYAVGKGVLVVLNDEINSAREVAKTNTYRLETFQSGQLGFLGYVDANGEVVFYRDVARLHTSRSAFSRTSVATWPRVDIVYSYAGADGAFINAACEAGTRGIVVAGTGAGLVSSAEMAALQTARAAGVMVVRSNRLGNGRVLPLAKYTAHGFVSADNLTPQKARILLMLALEKTNDVHSIQAFFDQY
ncbi:asparaginase domain-containing protein [Alicyclobacillus acidoterrestris]|uniref:asparaginase domain-containing protein n=2 Tax=Alicyclobacillus acidoterrestris TaxID=1450 RepID=UPI000406E6DD|nr:asparaginase domain-containing protein [Alicyclobacillus acidoterrestris]GEO25278.1 hypothetical protein AAC03nite_10630 [Alicyclobacillus acidoterrestris]